MDEAQSSDANRRHAGTAYSGNGPRLSASIVHG